MVGSLTCWELPEVPIFRWCSIILLFSKVILCWSSSRDGDLWEVLCWDCRIPEISWTEVFLLPDKFWTMVKSPTYDFSVVKSWLSF